MIGNGIYCSNTDPCSPNPCYPGVECTLKPAPGDFSCGLCPDGHYGDGLNCTQMINPCDSNPCYPDVRCTNLNYGLYLCGDCPEGTAGNGTDCKGAPKPSSYLGPYRQLGFDLQISTTAAWTRVFRGYHAATCPHPPEVSPAGNAPLAKWATASTAQMMVTLQTLV